MIKFEIPKGRSLNKNDFIKENTQSISIPRPLTETKTETAPINVTSCQEVIVEDIPVKISTDEAAPKRISIKTLQVYEVDDDKKNPILVRKSIQIEKTGNADEKENKKEILVEYKQIDGGEGKGEGEGKISLQKYIEEK